jgi:hypothetical protein
MGMPGQTHIHFIHLCILTLDSAECHHVRSRDIMTDPSQKAVRMLQNESSPHDFCGLQYRPAPLMW